MVSGIEALKELRDVINETIRMHQLNYELLEQLGITCKWLLENGVILPNKEKFIRLLNKVDALRGEIQLDASLFIRRKFTREKSDEDFTEPF